MCERFSQGNLKNFCEFKKRGRNASLFLCFLVSAFSFVVFHSVNATTLTILHFLYAVSFSSFHRSIRFRFVFHLLDAILPALEGLRLFLCQFTGRFAVFNSILLPILPPVHSVLSECIGEGEGEDGTENDEQY